MSPAATSAFTKSPQCRAIAARVAWWQSVDQATADSLRFICRVMTFGTWDDVLAVRAHFGGIDAALDAVLDRLDNKVAINHDDLCDREGAYFGEGRVVLIGDAAHPMTPNAGQGAGTAIEDAGMLALMLPDYVERPEVLPAALAERRRERVCSVQKLAWRIGQVGHWRNPIARFVRNLAVRATPQSVLDRQARAMWQPGIEIALELRASGHFD